MKRVAYIILVLLGISVHAQLGAQNQLDSSLCYFEQKEIVIVLKKDQMLKDAMGFLETMDIQEIFLIPRLGWISP